MVVAFAKLWKARHPESEPFRGRNSTARTFAYLRIAHSISGTGARLATDSGGLTLSRTGFAPAGRQTKFHEGIASSNSSWPAWPGRTNVRIHGTTHEVPKVRLEHERASLGSLQVPPYDLSMVSSRRSSKDGFISYGGNRYSVPAAYALSLLTVREQPHGILEIYAALDCIARHSLASGRHQSVVDPAHFESLWQALKSRRVESPRSEAGPLVGAMVAEPQVEVRSLDLYDALCEGD